METIERTIGEKAAQHHMTKDPKTKGKHNQQVPCAHCELKQKDLQKDTQWHCTGYAAHGMHLYFCTLKIEHEYGFFEI